MSCPMFIQSKDPDVHWDAIHQETGFPNCFSHPCLYQALGMGSPGNRAQFPSMHNLGLQLNVSLYKTAEVSPQLEKLRDYARLASFALLHIASLLCRSTLILLWYFGD